MDTEKWLCGMLRRFRSMRVDVGNVSIETSTGTARSQACGRTPGTADDGEVRSVIVEREVLTPAYRHPTTDSVYEGDGTGLRSGIQ